MLNTERELQWSAILSLSDKMLGAARTEQWDTLVELEAKRRRLMESFFARTALESEATYLQHGITQVLAMDKEIYKLSQLEKRKVEEKLATLKKNKNASDVYFRNSHG
jgi:hypothetical protein